MQKERVRHVQSKLLFQCQVKGRDGNFSFFHERFITTYYANQTDLFPYKIHLLFFASIACLSKIYVSEALLQVARNVIAGIISSFFLRMHLFCN